MPTRPDLDALPKTLGSLFQTAVFQLTVFIGAFLLFLLEPIAAKQLLPSFGGSAAVWITCLVFFQAALLAGYAYAAWLSRAPQTSPQTLRVHGTLLAAAFLTAIFWGATATSITAPGAHPNATLVLRLALAVGLPFIALAATSPLLQVWIARLHAGPVPYHLYGLSNLASLLALAAYPTLLEPYFTLRAQRLLWTTLFAIFAALSVYLTRLVQQTRLPPEPRADETTGPPSTRRDRLLWLLLPLAASIQLSAVTAHLTANIAAIPLLWILPLAVYLLSLIAAFQFPSLLPQGLIARLLAVMLASLAYMLSKVDVSLPITVAILFYLFELFLAAQFCHAGAYALRPARTAEATKFYLYFAAGGALGAFLIGILFPLLFSANYDLAIAFFLTAAATAATLWPRGWSQRLLWTTGTLLLFGLLLLQHAAYQRDTLFSERNFYGTLRVQQVYNGHAYPTRVLANGAIRHGTQIFTPSLVTTPTTYYAPDSGVGLALRFCCGAEPRVIGVIGLGTGTVAAYGHPGDHIRFYEINPAVLPVAQNLFTYLRQSPANIQTIQGDARTSLTNEPPQHFSVLVIDAFSGDAIPMHLLTAEAMQVYLRHLAPGGILAFHVSNQHVDLQPAIAQLAAAVGMQSRTSTNSPNDNTGAFRSTWVLVTRNQNFFDQPELANLTTATTTRQHLSLWTDDYSSLLPLLR